MSLGATMNTRSAGMLPLPGEPVLDGLRAMVRELAQGVVVDAMIREEHRLHLPGRDVLGEAQEVARLAGRSAIAIDRLQVLRAIGGIEGDGFERGGGNALGGEILLFAHAKGVVERGTPERIALRRPRSPARPRRA